MKISLVSFHVDDPTKLLSSTSSAAYHLGDRLPISDMRVKCPLVYDQLGAVFQAILQPVPFPSP